MSESFKFNPHKVGEQLNKISTSEQIAKAAIMTHDAALLFILRRIHGQMLHARKNMNDQRVLYWESSQFMLEDLIQKLQDGQPLPGEQGQLF